MQYNYLGKTGLQVSELCLGTMTFGRETEEKTAINMVHRFEEAGGNFIDTADAYGSKPGLSEEITGKALKGKREKFILATKVCMPNGPGINDKGLSRTHIMQAIDASLKRLQTDYVDIYFIHCWNSKTPLEDSLFTLDNLVKLISLSFLKPLEISREKLTSFKLFHSLHTEHLPDQLVNSFPQLSHI